MNEIKKENDIFLSTILNPNASINDLVHNGLNQENTGLLSPEEYKKSKFVQKQFSDEKGNFNQDLFDKIYLYAAKQYQDLTNRDLYNNIEKYISYNKNDIYAPLGAQLNTPSYDISKTANPYATSEGIYSLFEKGPATKSIRELAQQSKIWDSEKNEWMDKTANELGILGSIFSVPLVYATWDENGTHIDPITGKTVSHKKGDWKLNDLGQFYTETLGDREGYGKQFVAATDTLTKEDSWLNKIDFFDSDGLTKSTTGTIFKLAAEIAPYMIPGFGEIWGGINAATQLAAVMPTFSKMLEGVIGGDKETAFTRKMNRLENYWKKFDDSYSDDAQNSTWGLQKMATLVGDIFGQLYQMRAMANLSNMVYGPQQQKIARDFANKFELEYKILANNPKSGLLNTPDGFRKFYESVVDKMPEMKALIESQSQVAKRLSLGYMALTSSADVYEDALAGGYDRRMAGLAGLAAAAGQYGIMMSEESLGLGTWFLDKTVGYHTVANRGVLKKALRPYYDEFAKGVKAMETMATPEEKLGKLAEIYKKVSKGIKQAGISLRDGTEPFWRNALTEGLEEVTEEAVMDATKGVFDTLSWLGVGKNSETASFGIKDDLFSNNWWSRYLQNFVGGLVGGTLFELQQNVIEPGIRSIVNGKVTPDVKASLIREIANGNTEELLKLCDEMAKYDKDVAAGTFEIDGETVIHSSDGKSATRGELASRGLKNYIKYLEGIIIDEKLNVSDETLFKKAIRDYTSLPLLEAANVHKLILEDFHTLSKDIVDIRTALEKVTPSEPKEEGEEKEKTSKKKAEKPETSKEVSSSDKYSKLSEEDLKEQLKQTKAKIQRLLNGEENEKYLKITLGYLNPAIRSRLLNMDKYTYTQAKYNVSYQDLPDSGASLSKDSLTKEYNEWRDQEDIDKKYASFVINAFDNLEQTFSQAFEDYINLGYADVRETVVEKVLSEENAATDLSSVLLTRSSRFSDDASRNILINISQKLRKNGLPGLSMEDIIKQNPDVLKEFVSKNLDSNLINYISKVSGKSKDEILDAITKGLAYQMESAGYLENIPTNANSLVAVWIQNELTPFLQEIGKQFTTKEDADLALVNLGISPSLEEIQENISDYFANLVSTNFKINDVESLGLNSSLLFQYLSNSEILDGEMVRILKNAVLNEIIKKKSDIADYFNSLESTVTMEVPDPEFPGEVIEDTVLGKLEFDSSDIDRFIELIKSGLNQNQSLNDIVDTWLLDPETGLLTKLENNDPTNSFRALLQINPNLQKDIVENVKDILASPAVSAYEIVKTKQIKQNPIYKILRELNLDLSEDKENIIWDILESEQAYLQNLDSAAEYLRQGNIKQQLDGAIATIQIAEAIALGMDSTEIDEFNPYGYNQQIKRYLEKYEQGKNAENYKTITSDKLRYILRDLANIEDKLTALRTLSDNNVTTKIQEDIKTKESLENTLLNKLQELGSALRIGGVSIYPLQDEIDKKKTNAEKLAFIEHYIYENFVKNASKDDVSKALYEVLSNVGINRDEIISSKGSSFGLDENTNKLSEYDIFVWLVSTLSSDSYEFSWKYKKILSDNSYDKVPFFGQEYATKIGYAFANDKLGIHEAAVEWLYQGNEDNPYLKNSTLFFLNGVSGAGKTSVVAKNIREMLNSDNIYICAPNLNQLVRFKNSLNIENAQTGEKANLFKYILTDEAFSKLQDSLYNPASKDSYVNEVGTDRAKHFDTNPKESWYRKAIKNIPKYIFIDEISHFSSVELKILDYWAKKNGVKVITFGDSLQDGFELISSDNQIVTSNIDDVFAWKAPKLQKSIRPSNINKNESVVNLARVNQKYESFATRGLANAEQNIREWITKNPTIIPYYETEQDLYGDKFVENLTTGDIQKIFNTAKRNNSKVGILTQLDQNNSMINTALSDKLKDAGLVEGTDYVLYSPERIHERAVQGSEEDFFIIDKIDLGKTYGQQLKKIYTFVTRSLAGSIIIADQNDLFGLNIVNELRSKNQPYITPQDSQKDEIKRRKLEELNSILGDWTFAEPEVEKTTTTIEQQTTKEKVKSEEQVNINIGSTAPGKVQLTALTPREPVFTSTNTKSLHGYASYNHLGVEKTSDNSGYYLQANDSTPLDLNGLTWDERRLSPYLVQGFIRFKNLLAFYYDDLTSDNFKKAIQSDDAIADLFLEIYPNLTDADSKTQKRNDAKDWILEHLQVDQNLYAFGLKYNENLDSPYGWIGSRDESTSPTLMLYGVKIYAENENGESVINQYISLGAFPDPFTMASNNVQNEAYSSLRKQVLDSLGNNRFITFKLNSSDSIKPKSMLQFHEVNKENFFESIYQMERQGVLIDKGRLYLIDDSQTSGHYTVLDYIAKVESNGDQKKYQEKLDALEAAFIQNDKLIISGKILALASFANNDSPEFKRFMILDPGKHQGGMKTAVGKIVAMSPHKRGSEGNAPFSEKLKQMNAYSQNQFILNALKQLGCWDNQGDELYITKDGIKQSLLRNYLTKLSERMGKNKNIPNDKALIDFIIKSDIDLSFDKFEDIILHGYSKNGIDYKPLHRSGIYFINEFVRGTGTDTDPFTLINLKTEKTDKYLKISWDNMPEAYYNFIPSSNEKIREIIDDTEYKFYTIDTGYADEYNNDFFHMGIYGYQLQMPIMGISDSIMQNAEVVTELPTHIEIDFSEKLKPYVEQDNTSWADQRKEFNPEKIQLKTPEYVIDESYNTQYIEISTKRGNKTVKIKKPIQIHVKNKYDVDIQLLDEVYIFGREQNYYKVGYVDTENAQVLLVQKNGQQMYPKRISIDEVSGIRTRILKSQKDLQYDYYQTNKELRKQRREAGKLNKNYSMPVEEFNTAILDEKTLFYYRVPFYEGETPEEVYKDSSRWIYSSVESLKNYTSNHGEEKGFLLLGFKKSVYNDPTSPIVVKEMQDNVTDGYIKHVIYFKGFEKEDTSVPKPKTSKSIQHYYELLKAGNGSIRMTSEEFEKSKLVGSQFIIKETSNGLTLYPKPTFFSENNLENFLVSQNPKFKVGDKIIGYFDDLSKPLSGFPITITGIETVDGVLMYQYQPEGKDKTYSKPVYEIDTLVGSKYELAGSNPIVITPESNPNPAPARQVQTSNYLVKMGLTEDEAKFVERSGIDFKRWATQSKSFYADAIKLVLSYNTQFNPGSEANPDIIDINLLDAIKSSAEVSKALIKNPSIVSDLVQLTNYLSNQTIATFSDTYRISIQSGELAYEVLNEDNLTEEGKNNLCI